MKFTSLIILAAAASVTLGLHPAQAQGNPPGINPEHYACYKVSAGPLRPMPVTLKDQFGVGRGFAVQAAFLCAPVSKNEQSIKDERTHLLCYTVRANKAANKRVQIVNQFGRSEMKVGPISWLCVPSLKRVL